MAFEIITYGAGPYLDNVFNGIAGIVDNEGYKIILNIALLTALFSVAYYTFVKGNIFVISKWFLGYVFAYSILFIPRVEILIIDRIYGDTPRIVKNIPFGIAVVAHLSSHIGDAITQLFEITFSTPDDIKYHKTGMLMASSMIENTAFLPIVDENFGKNLRGFIHQCVVYEAMRGREYTIEDLKKCNDIWALVTEKASKAHAFAYNNEIVTCSEGGQKLSVEWKTQIEKAKTLYGNRYFRKSETKVIDNGVFLAHLPGAYNYLLNISKTAEEILQQQLMLQAIIDGVDSFASETGSAAAVQQFATARAKIQQNASYAVVGKLALEKLPLMRAIFECLLYGIFPLVFLLILLPQGINILILYVKSLFWIHSWGPLFALLNVFFSYSAKIGSISASSVTGGICLETLPGIYDVNSKIAAFAGFMSSFIPILTWSIFKNGPGVLANMSASLFGINQSSAMSAAEEATTGNIRYGNTDFDNHSMNNVSANKYDSNASVSAGAFSMQGEDMIHYTVSPNGEVIADSSRALSRFATHANETETMREVIGENSVYSQQKAYQNQVSFEERAAASIAASAMLGEHLSKERSTSDSFSSATSKNAAEYAKSAHDDLERKSHSEGSNDVTGDQDSFTKSLRGGGGVNVGASSGSNRSDFGLGLKASIDLGVEKNLRNYHDNSHSSSDSVGTEHSDSYGSGSSEETAFRTLAEELSRKGDTKGASLAYKADAALQEANSAAHSWQESISESDAWSELASKQSEYSSGANFNWDQVILNRVAQMPAPGSATGEMGVIQAAQVLNNPLLAKDYVHQATQEFLQEKIQSRKSLPLENQERNLENIYQENKFSINSQHEKNRQDFREKYKEKADAID